MQGTQGSSTVSHSPVVLLVEDDDSSREMYSLYLEASGLWVLDARDGADALIKARTFLPHVVVTDVVMPIMDGWELAKALRENERTSGIGIIAVSGRPADEATVHVHQHHVDVILEKPCLPDDLLKAIKQLLARGQLARVRASEQIARASRLRARSAELVKVSKKHQARRRK
jgi:DNA-binding response OmpR family regulator